MSAWWGNLSRLGMAGLLGAVSAWLAVAETIAVGGLPGQVDSDSVTYWQDRVPESGWVSRLDVLSGGPPPESVLGGPEIIVGISRGRMVCLSSGLRGPNWLTGPGGGWLVVADGGESRVGDPGWDRMVRTPDATGQRLEEVWLQADTGIQIRLTWTVDPSGPAVECGAAIGETAGTVHLAWMADLAPEAPFPAIWSGMFRGGMEMVWVPVSGVPDTFLAAAAWLPDPFERSRWEDIQTPGLDDLRRYLRADRLDRDIPGKMLGWRVSTEASVRFSRIEGWALRLFRQGGWRKQVNYPVGTAGHIRYVLGTDPATVMNTCMVRRETAGIDESGRQPRARHERSVIDLMEMATDPESDITVAHPGRGNAFRVTRPDWAWLAGREWIRRGRPERAAAQLEPFLRRFDSGFVPGPEPLNAPALVNVAGEPVLPRVFDGFGDTALTVLATVDLLNQEAIPLDTGTRSRWLNRVEQAMWSLYWQSDPTDGTPPPVFHPARGRQVVGETDWLTTLAVLAAVEPLFRREGRQMPSEWGAWQRLLETKIRFRLREAGEAYAWPVRPMMAILLSQRPDMVNLPDVARLNAAGRMFPHRMVRAVLPDLVEALPDAIPGYRTTVFSSIALEAATPE